ncbi:MAG TPA: hypothetical protein VJ952_04470 [Opitutales bacterium]|nr:hypothetical protein [Opitutales bacterium]
MSLEENDAIARLLDPEASAFRQKAALKWIEEYLEESYILNLAMPNAVLRALEKFSKRSKADKSLKLRANKLINKYER